MASSDEDQIKTILNNIEPRDLYKKTVDKPIKILVNYSSLLGRLSGYQENTKPQKFEKAIKKPESGASKEIIRDQGIILIESGLATLMERYSVFGPFNQYSKTFYIGPSQFNFKTGKIIPLDTSNKLHIRDVDRVIWIKPIDQIYYLGYIDLFHEYSEIGIVKSEWVIYNTSKSESKISAEFDIDEIFDKIFSDGKSYEIHEIANTEKNKIVSFLDDDPMDNILDILWISEDLGKNRFHNIKKIMDITEKKTKRDFMLASILIGHMGFINPANENQRLHPVSLGLITPKKINTVLRNIILVPKSTTPIIINSKKSFENVYSESESESESELSSFDPDDEEDDLLQSNMINNTGFIHNNNNVYTENSSSDDEEDEKKIQFGLLSNGFKLSDSDDEE